MSQLMQSGLPESDESEEFPTADQRKILKGGKIGAAINGTLGAAFSLTPIFSKLTASPVSLHRTLGIAFLAAVVGFCLGSLIASPTNDAPKNLNNLKPPVP